MSDQTDRWLEKQARRALYDATMTTWRGLPFGPSTKKAFSDSGITFTAAVELVIEHEDDEKLLREFDRLAKQLGEPIGRPWAYCGASLSSVAALRAYLVRPPDTTAERRDECFASYAAVPIRHAKRALARAGVSLEDIAAMTDERLLDIRGVSRMTVRLLRQHLAIAYLDFEPEGAPA